MRLEGWGGPTVRDAVLRTAPHHEAEISFGLWIPAFAGTTAECHTTTVSRFAARVTPV